MLTIPYLADDRLAQLRLYLRQQDRRRAGDAEVEAKESTRFVVEVRLSRLGDLQFDGLVLEPKKRFDLVLRSRHPLAAEARQAVRSRFHSASKAAGYTGELSFHAGPPLALLHRGLVGRDPAGVIEACGPRDLMPDDSSMETEVIDGDRGRTAMLLEFDSLQATVPRVVSGHRPPPLR